MAKSSQMSPTNLEWWVNLGGDDYRRKQTKKAEAEMTLPFSWDDVIYKSSFQLPSSRIGDSVAVANPDWSEM